MDHASDPVSGPVPVGRATPAGGPSAARQTVEFLVVLLLGILMARTFAAEAYIVPTGSMAPTLLGMHRDYACPNCGLRFAVGMDEQGRSGRPVCPNCGLTDWDRLRAVEASGDRLLVQKFLYDLRPPRRWETAVFQNPNEPSQAYVKRVVGLPGEMILIRGGDVYIDGRIARKSLEQQRSMGIPVYDNEFPPRDADRFPRWVFRHGRGPFRPPSGWRAAGTHFRRDPVGTGDDVIDWLEYRHWQPDRAAYGPIRDFLAYNGSDLFGENRVADLMLRADVAVGPGVRAVVVRIQSGADRFLVTLPVGGPAPVEVRRNGRYLPPGIAATSPLVASSPEAPRVARLEVSLMDQRLIVAVDDRPLFEPIDYDDPTPGPGPGDSPLAIGVQGEGVAEVSHLRVDRDIYYTEALTGAPRRPFGVEEPYPLGPGEFFVLGDNSPVSNDSRFWPSSPVVRREMFLGKPFLVHLPSQAVPLEVFGRELYWIPDPREIRYIR